MTPELVFHQSVVDPTNGHCFAISVKWVGLMLGDPDSGRDYLARDVSRRDATVKRTWRNTKARMALSIEEGRKDADLEDASQGLPIVQREMAGPWIRRYSRDSVASVRVLRDLDDVDEEECVDALADAIAGSNCEGFLVSSSAYPHTIGVVYADGYIYWFDPNEGVFNLGPAIRNCAAAVKEICRQTEFEPGWVLGVWQ